jgi:hypothetical protein
MRDATRASGIDLLLATTRAPAEKAVRSSSAAGVSKIVAIELAPQGAKGMSSPGGQDRRSDRGGEVCGRPDYPRELLAKAYPPVVASRIAAPMTT